MPGTPITTAVPILWPDRPAQVTANSPQDAALIPMHAPSTVPQAGSMYRDGAELDLQWHFHEMHQLSYAF
jgi:hypothetical protein